MSIDYSASTTAHEARSPGWPLSRQRFGRQCTHVVVSLWYLLVCFLGYASSDTSSPQQPGSRVFFAAPDGHANSDGSLAHPWDLRTALQPGKVPPGSTLRLRGGTYYGSFHSYLRGTKDAPAIIEPYAGERATLDGKGMRTHVLFTHGNFSIYRNFEITNSDPNRTTYRWAGIYTMGDHQKFINLVIHDTGVGLGTFSESAGIEIYGCLIYNVGWQGPFPDRGHGHGIYIQNSPKTSLKKLVTDNVIFNQYGWGIHAYSEGKPGEGSLAHLYFKGNVIFNSGSLTFDDERNPNILVGGYIPASDILLAQNYTYHTESHASSSPNVILGNDSTENQDVTCNNNYFVGGTAVLQFYQPWLSVTGRNNTLYGAVDLLSWVLPRSWHYNWTSNRYFSASGPGRISSNGVNITLTQAVKYLGVDQGSSETVGRPQTPAVFVRPDKYTQGRANIIVYNWPLTPGVYVDLSPVLAIGAHFEVRNAQDYFGTPVTTGTYNGQPAYFPLEARYPAPAIGATHTAPLTGPEFNVYIVTTK